MKLEKSSQLDSEKAEMETVDLKKQLSQSKSLVAKLMESKAVFQQESADVFAVLGATIFPSDFYRAMEHHFSLVTKDNSFLLSKILEHTQELSNKDLEAASLKARILETNQALEEKGDRCRSLETRIREQEDQIGAHEMEMDALSNEDGQIDDLNTAIIADMERRLRAAYAYVDESRVQRERKLFRN